MSGSEISGITLEDDVTLIDYVSACGGVPVTLSADPQLFDSLAGNGIDCVTAERIAYAPSGSFPITAGTNNAAINRDPSFYQDFFPQPLGTQWQTYNPQKGARVGLAGGSPMAMDANGNMSPLGPGSSFYRWLGTVAGADYTLSIQPFALANTDTELTTYIRWVDANNNIRVRYTPSTTTWDLIQKIAGIDTVLATDVHDLSSHGAGGMGLTIQGTGTSIIITASAGGLPGTYPTALTAAGPFAFLVIATGAANMGYAPGPLATHP